MTSSETTYHALLLERSCAVSKVCDLYVGQLFSCEANKGHLESYALSRRSVGDAGVKVLWGVVGWGGGLRGFTVYSLKADPSLARAGFVCL
jgi:hypothetical protein